MKICLLSLVIIISSIGLSSFSTFETLQFQLIEAKSNTPLRNHNIEMYSIKEIVLDAPWDLEFIKKIKTDNQGFFKIGKNRLKEYGVTLELGEQYKSALISANDKDEIWFFRYRNGFSQTIAKTRYDLKSKVETNFNLKNDTTSETEFERIKVFAYDLVGYYDRFRNQLKSNQNHLNYDQEQLWNFVWNEFEKSVDYETTPPFNFRDWFSHLMICDRLFDLKIEAIFNETKSIKDPTKKYYHLCALCWIFSIKNQMPNKKEEQILKWIDKEVALFYIVNPDLDFLTRNEKLPEDMLAPTYLSMKENISKSKK